MRILCLNANTTVYVTELVARTLREVLGDDAEIVAVTGDFGPAVIRTGLDHAVAEHVAVTLGARHGSDVDAVLVAVSFDTATDALREALDVPVVGISEAAIATARMVGGRIGYVSIGALSNALYRETLARYDVSRDMAGWRTIEAPSAYAPGDTSAVDALLLDAAAALADEGADVIVLLGAVLAGAAARLRGAAELPLVDGGQAGALMVSALARLGPLRRRRGRFALRSGAPMSGVDPALSRLSAGADEGDSG